MPVCLSAYLSGRIHLKITSGIKTALARACDSTSAAGSVNTESEDPDLFQPGNDPATIKHNTGRTVAAAVLPSHSHLGTYCPGDTPMLLLLSGSVSAGEDDAGGGSSVCLTDMSAWRSR